ncbi:XRE family transcriptional regulator [Candidatus Thiomargarita nelsonii]|uniref:XRE family transcriptional regulator n=1 Tax=Candidatus Thiomargarita nelsonii TaxID=1003181 RepID=A0A0A6PHS6_9GAMM|nr:XRE family transcriptional regulator [Candidatus Thiomargarita nelsonii]
MDIEKIAKAIEMDAGERLPDIRESLQEMVDGKAASVHTPEQLMLRTTRQKLGLSQSDFARLIRTPVTTLCDWEQGRFNPPGSLMCLVEIADKRPDVLRDVLM